VQPEDRGAAVLVIGDKHHGFRGSVWQPGLAKLEHVFDNEAWHSGTRSFRGVSWSAGCPGVLSRVSQKSPTLTNDAAVQAANHLAMVVTHQPGHVSGSPTNHPT
jgi:hypothetical protein